MYKCYAIYKCVTAPELNSFRDKEFLEVFVWDLYDMAVARYREMLSNYPDEKFMLVEECFNGNITLGDKNNAIT